MKLSKKVSFHVGKTGALQEACEGHRDGVQEARLDDDDYDEWLDSVEQEESSCKQSDNKPPSPPRDDDGEDDAQSPTLVSTQHQQQVEENEAKVEKSVDESDETNWWDTDEEDEDEDEEDEEEGHHDYFEVKLGVQLAELLSEQHLPTFQMFAFVLFAMDNDITIDNVCAGELTRPVLDKVRGLNECTKDRLSSAFEAHRRAEEAFNSGRTALGRLEMCGGGKRRRRMSGENRHHLCFLSPEKHK